MSSGTTRASAPPRERREASSGGGGVEGEERATSKTRTGRPVGTMSAINLTRRYGSGDGDSVADRSFSSNPSMPRSLRRAVSCCCLRLLRRSGREICFF